MTLPENGRKLGRRSNSTQCIASVYKLHCTKDDTHAYVYIIERKGDNATGYELKKIGQIPTVADIAFGNFSDIKKKLAKLVDPAASIEFSKAQGLYAHGLGLPPFVYLRRIVERLVWKTFNAEKTKNAWLEDDFLRLRIKERIEFLKDHLPARLFEYRNIYSILSRGIHELTEEQCLKAYPKLEKAIELMVRDEIRKDQEKEEALELKKFIDDPDLK